MKVRAICTAAVLALGLAVCAQAAAPVNTIVVTPDNMAANGWGLRTASGEGWPVVATAGIVSAPDGEGALMLNHGVTYDSTRPIDAQYDADQTAQGRLSSFYGTKLADVTTLSYSTYVTNFGTSNSDPKTPYIYIFVDHDGNLDTFEDLLFYEPAIQASGAVVPELNTWQTWNALDGVWRSNMGFAGMGFDGQRNTIAHYFAADSRTANATIINTMRFCVGFSGSWSDGMVGYVDDIRIGTANGLTVYDFEPAAVPEPASLLALGTGLVSLAGFVTRRKRA